MEDAWTYGGVGHAENKADDGPFETGEAVFVSPAVSMHLRLESLRPTYETILSMT
jgi:hypothetical protein